MKQRGLQGVNLGGWLIVERWMTPSLFKGSDAIDEYTLAATPQGRKKLERHRATFIQEEDFAWMASHDVEIIRIPFGYWLFVEDHNYVGGLAQLDWAVEMAEKYHIKVLLDIHALPGSQNGKHHSGRIGESEWFGSKWHRQTSLDVCKKVAQRYAASPALWGIQIINEPSFGWRQQYTLIRYYRQAYRVLAEILPNSTYVVFSDAFRPYLLAGALRRRTRGPRVAMDIHWYSWMMPLWKVSRLEHFFARITRHTYTIHTIQRLAHPVIIGEWGAVLPHALKPYIGDQSWREATTKHYLLQYSMYSQALAQCYWTYKTEKDGMWSYRYIHEKVLSESPDDATLEVL